MPGVLLALFVIRLVFGDFWSVPFDRLARNPCSSTDESPDPSGYEHVLPGHGHLKDTLGSSLHPEPLDFSFRIIDIAQKATAVRERQRKRTIESAVNVDFPGLGSTYQ